MVGIVGIPQIFGTVILIIFQIIASIKRVRTDAGYAVRNIDACEATIASECMVSDVCYATIIRNDAIFTSYY